jgi:hypothetical protein
LLDVQDPPDTHATQAPLRHTCPEPQLAVPSGWWPVAWHTGTPVAHEMVPVWHGSLGVHAAPAVHATQVPLPLHTRLVPQLVPAGWWPFATHWALPLEHDRVPVWQRLVGWHALPLAHDSHMPSVHTLPLPQSVPLLTGVQVPVAHELHVPHVILQQMPELQRPVAHCVSITQAPPAATLSLQAPLAQ